MKKRRSLSRKSLPKKEHIPPVQKFAIIKNPAARNQVRGFVAEYAQDPEFEAFELLVDGIPFVALSLMNAHPDLRGRFKPVPPPTPMKKHTPGINSPRKRPLRRESISSVNSKSVRFTDEGSSFSKRARKSSSGDVDSSIRELGETVSDAMIDTGRQYNDLWKDRAHSVEK